MLAYIPFQRIKSVALIAQKENSVNLRTKIPLQEDFSELYFYRILFLFLFCVRCKPV